MEFTGEKFSEKETTVKFRPRGPQSRIGKFGLLMWKNYLLRKRHWILTFFELAVPTGLMCLLVFLRTIPDSNFQPKPVEDTSYYRAADETELSKILCSRSLGVWNVVTNRCHYDIVDELPGARKLFWGPPNDFTKRMAERVIDDIFFTWNDQENVTSNEELNDRIDSSYFESNQTVGSFYIGIFFNLDDPESDNVPWNLNYDLRLQKIWMTYSVYPLLQIPGPRNHSEGMFSLVGSYTMDGFVLLQTYIDRAFMREIAPGNEIDYTLETQMYPYPPFIQDFGLSQFYGNILPTFIVFSLVLLSPTLIKSIVYEKETGVRELIRMMGMQGWLIWLGWFIYSFVIIFIVCFIITIMLKVKVTTEAIGVLSPIFIYSSPTLIWVLLILYGISSISFCFAISCFFSRPTLATTLGVLAWVMSFFLPSAIMNDNYDNISLGSKLASCLLPNMSMTWAFRIMGMFEGKAIGIQWDNLWDEGNTRDQLNIAIILIMLVFDTFLYFLITWYVDQIMPGTYGVPRPWYFLATKSFWFGAEKKSSNETESDREECSNDGNFEPEPQGATVGIKVRGLRKEFRTFPGIIKVAVDKVDLVCYKGQCTVLLGHNGAGKTTTMSMLTGVYAPSGGWAELNGWNITSHLKEARSVVGLCPQHNTLFTDLSVEEHLIFFARLKGLSRAESRYEASNLLNRLQLEEKKYQFGNQLSGGMKRKLCLSIALIGGSEVVILDEPSSGLDPESRRWVWDVIQKERGQRTVLVSTHHMEEADVLGDRVAIMSNGKVVCSGTGLYLKNKFGDGYTLSVIREGNSNIERISEVVRNHLPDSSLSDSRGKDIVTYKLTPDTAQFPALLDELSRRKQELDIKHMGLSLATMEQVFLKVGHTLDDKDSKEGVSNPTFVHEEVYEEENHNDVEERIDQTDFRLKGWRLTLERLQVLFVKKFIYTRRKWVLLITQALIPVFVSALCLLVDATLDEQDFKEPSVKLSINMFEYTYSSVESLNNTDDLTQSYIDQFQSPYNVSRTNDLNATLLNAADDDITIYRENCMTSAYFREIEEFANTSTSIATRILYQSIPYHAPGVGTNIMNNAILGTILKEKGLSREEQTRNITTYNRPLPISKLWQIDEDQTTYSSFLFSMMMPLALAFLTSSFLVFPLQERVSNAKQIQQMTGTPTWTLWITAFFWDLLSYLLSIILVFGCFMLLDSKGYFTAEGAPGTLFLLLFLYGVASIPMAYVFSFWFSTAASGFALLALLNIFTGVIVSLVSITFDVINSDDLRKASDIIGNITSFVPSYPASKAFKSLIDVSNYNRQCDILNPAAEEELCNTINITLPESPYMPCCEQYCAYHGECFTPQNYLSIRYPGVGMFFIYFVIDMIFYFLLLFLIEVGIGDVIQKAFWRCRDWLLKPDEKSTNTKQSMREIDDDVLKLSLEAERLMKEPNSDSALVVHRLTKTYPNADVVAVDRISFHVRKAECFGLLGVNGAGKTTTFRMLTGDEVRTHGDARIGQHLLSGGRKKFMEEIGYCPQFDAIINELTGDEMLSLMAGLRGIKRKDRSKMVSNLVELVDLTEYHLNQCGTYSGGNKRKLNTAMALIGNPPLVFLDEPTSGVDPASRRRVWKSVTQARRNGQSVILTSHSMDECEALCDRVVIMARGRLRCEGTPNHLKAKFGRGYTLQVKIRTDLSSRVAEQKSDKDYQQLLRRLKYSIVYSLPGSALTDEYRGMLAYRVPSSISWSRLFHCMESIKSGVNPDSNQSENTHDHSFGIMVFEEFKEFVEDYAAMDPSLEQVFLTFARDSQKSDAESFNWETTTKL